MPRKTRTSKDEETQPPLTQRPGFIIGMTFLAVVAAVIISVLIFRFIRRRKAARKTENFQRKIEARSMGAASIGTKDDNAGQLPEADFERFSSSRRKDNRKAARKFAKAEDLSRRKPAAAAKQRALQRAAKAPSVLGKRNVEQTKPSKQNILKKKRKVKGPAFFNKEKQRALQQAAAEYAAEYAEEKRIVEEAILQQAAAEQKALQREAAKEAAAKAAAQQKSKAKRAAAQQKSKAKRAAAQQKTSQTPPIYVRDRRGNVMTLNYNPSTRTWEG